MAKVSLADYGQNQSAGPSSIAPGDDVDRSLYAPPLSDAHERVLANGVASNPQLRKIDSRPAVDPAYGMRYRNANPATVPSATKRK